MSDVFYHNYPACLSGLSADSIEPFQQIITILLRCIQLAQRHRVSASRILIVHGEVIDNSGMRWVEMGVKSRFMEKGVFLAGKKIIAVLKS